MPQRTTRKLILVVDDDPGDEALTLRALRKSGVELDIDIVRDGAEALDYMFCEGTHATRDPGVQPSVVLLDLKLVKLDGLEVLRALRADPRTRLIPVVILSSSDMESDIRRAYEAGAFSYLRKTIDFPEFTEVMRIFVKYWCVINQPNPRV